MDADFDEMESMMQYDPEIDYEMQPQNIPGGNLVEDDDVKTVRGDDPPEESKYQSLYGFANYDQFQNQIIDDILSDDEGGAKKKKSKKLVEED